MIRNNRSGKVVSNLMMNEPNIDGSYTLTFRILRKLHDIVKFIYLNLSVVMYPEIKKINYFQILKFRRREFYF